MTAETNPKRPANDSSKASILARIVNQYLGSRDFNGIPAHDLGLLASEGDRLIGELVQEGTVTIAFGDVHPNPHIKAFDADEIPVQLEKLRAKGIEDTCLYPSKAILRSSRFPVGA